MACAPMSGAEALQDAPLPEQPEWNAAAEPASTPAAAIDASTSPSDDESLPTAPAMDNTPAAEPLPSNNPSVPPAANPSEISAASEIGVPKASNFYLPSLDNYGRPFFERQGLRFRAGPLNLRMSLSVGAEYNSNIFGSNTNVVGDYITHISPTILLGLGDFQTKTEDFFLLNYHPSFDYYLSQTQQNRLNQNLEIVGQATLSRYSTTVDLSYMSSNLPNATQTGGQDYTNFLFTWDNRYYLGAKTFARAMISANTQTSENQNNYQTFAISPQIGYAYSPKTTISFGPFAGVSDIGNGGSQTFQGLSVGINYTTLRKLQIDASFGIQARQFDEQNATGATNFMTPVFNVAVTYTATANTTVNLGLLRDVQLSDIQRGLTYTNSQINFGVTQHIHTHFTLGFGLSYQLLEYQGEAPLGRTDQYVSGGPTLRYSFWRDLFNFSLFYRYQKRTSNLQQFEYDVTSYGFSLSYSF